MCHRFQPTGCRPWRRPGYRPTFPSPAPQSLGRSKSARESVLRAALSVRPRLQGATRLELAGPFALGTWFLLVELVSAGISDLGRIFRFGLLPRASYASLSLDTM